MSSVWNLLSSLRSGRVPILGSGQEMYGTVMKKSPCNKTVKVLQDNYSFINTENPWFFHFRFRSIGDCTLPFLEPPFQKVPFEMFEVPCA